MAKGHPSGWRWRFSRRVILTTNRRLIEPCRFRCLDELAAFVAVVDELCRPASCALCWSAQVTVRWTRCQRAGCFKRWLDYTRDMKIGAAARASGLTIKAIRHYESVCLLRNVPRSGAYRDFSDRDVDTLRLAAHCRGLGFSVAETKDVLALVTASEPDCPPRTR